MGLTYYKRFRMEIDLHDRVFTAGPMPRDFHAIRWDDTLLESHAEAKYLSFREEIDSNLFPCLGDYAGCVRLMGEIRHKDGFLPGASWLIVQEAAGGIQKNCGTIQGIRDHAGLGAVQNLGVTPECRGQGIGEHLLVRALQGFQRAGLRRAYLEVTAQNVGAIRLYQRVGFARARTVYKAVEVAYS